MTLSIVDLNGKMEAKSVHPKGDFLFVRDLNAERSSGGIELPGGARSECRFAEVKEAGPGLLDKEGNRIPLPVSAGDIIVMMDYAGEYLELRDGRYRFVHAVGAWAKVTLKSTETLEIESLVPVNDKLLVEVKDEEKSPGGIVLPDDPKLRWATGLVHSVSKGFHHQTTGAFIELDILSGDKIVFMRYAGAVVEIGGKKLRLIQKADVLCVVEKEG